MANNYVDYKTIIWRRAFFTEDADMQKVTEVIQRKNLNDIFDEDLGFIEDIYLPETEYYLPPKENYNMQTIEVYEENKIIWNNEIK